RQPGRADVAHRHAGIGADPRAAGDPDEFRQSARGALGEPAVRAAHLHGVFQPAVGEPGARRHRQALVHGRLVDGARGDAARAARAVRAPPAAAAAALAAAMRIPTLERYLARQIYAAVGFVLLAFLALFAFFDLIAELRDLGNGSYQLRQIFTVVALMVPGHAYELLPIAVLIGTLYVLAHLSSNS